MIPQFFVSIFLVFFVILIVEIFPRDVNYICEIDRFKGLYMPYNSPYTKCCKEKYLVSPTPLASCQTNVSRDNQEDDLATLMWKAEACVIKTYLGMSEDAIDFQTFVNFRVTNYTSENNVTTVIKQANTQCPDVTEGLAFHKKIEAYTLCFFRNEEKVCNEPTENATKSQQNREQRLSQKPPSCPLNLKTKGLGQILCCGDKPTPHYWRSWLEFKNVPYTTAEDGKQVLEKSYSECISTAKSQVAVNTTNKVSIESVCDMACILNPVVFKNGTEGPEINWNFQNILEDQFASFNKAIRKNLTDISDKLKSNKTKPFQETSYKNGTAMSFDELEKAYVDSRDPVEKVLVYCDYYKELFFTALRAFQSYCQPDIK